MYVVLSSLYSTDTVFQILHILSKKYTLVQSCSTGVLEYAFLCNDWIHILQNVFFMTLPQMNIAPQVLDLAAQSSPHPACQ